MISYLKGKIIGKNNGFVVVEVNNIGYRVFVSPLFFTDLTVGPEAEFYTHQYVREDALSLYGFKSMEELGLFELLLSVSGIGPKSALGVMSIAAVADVKGSISRGDPAMLTKVSGVGRKTAERVVLELREKIGKINGKTATGAGTVSGDEIDALMALGYSLAQARDALNGLGGKIKNSGERIRQALKRLGK